MKTSSPLVLTTTLALSLLGGCDEVDEFDQDYDAVEDLEYDTEFRTAMSTYYYWDANMHAVVPTVGAWGQRLYNTAENRTVTVENGNGVAAAYPGTGNNLSNLSFIEVGGDGDAQDGGDVVMLRGYGGFVCTDGTNVVGSNYPAFSNCTWTQVVNSDGTLSLLSVQGNWLTISAGTLTTTSVSTPSQQSFIPAGTPSMNPQPPVGGSLGQWHLDGSRMALNGAPAAVLSGATWSSSAAPISSRNPVSLEFDGLGDYASIPDSDAVDFAAGQDFTVAVWIRAGAQNTLTNGDNDVVEKWDGTGSYPYVIRYVNSGADAGKLVAARYDGVNNPGGMSSTSIGDGAFHHVAFVKDGATLHLYIDGALEWSIPDTCTGTTTNSSPLYLGRRGGAMPNYFTGAIDDLHIYGHALNAGGIAALMVR